VTGSRIGSVQRFDVNVTLRYDEFGLVLDYPGLATRVI
jgi:hypothetical protein